MRRILVLRGGALGDLIVTLPALDALRQRWPEAEIVLIGNAVAGELAKAAGLVNSVFSQHEAQWAGLYGAEVLPRALADWLADFDLVINYWPDPEREVAARFPLVHGQKFLSAAALPSIRPGAAHYGEPLRGIGLELRDVRYDLSRCIRPKTSRPIAAEIAIHPGSGSPRKNWPAERWRALASWLREKRRLNLLIVTGEAESNSAESWQSFGRVACNYPLLELAGELARCRLFLGHDSGVSHLAAALGLPAVLLFGPTDSAMWAPPGSHVRVLRQGDALAGISLDAMKQAVTAALVDQT